MITIVEALLLKDLLDSIHVFYDFQRHFLVFDNVLVEGNKFDFRYSIYKVFTRHFGYQLLLLDDDNEDVALDVHDADHSVSGKLNATVKVFILFC
jgi:hypothetical protein